MTVCVGAICEGGKAAVVAADEMVTFGPPMNLQTEPPVFTKISKLTAESVLLFAGNVPDGEEILVGSRTKLGGMGKLAISQVGEVVKAAYMELKRKRAEETILIPFLGANFSAFQTLAAGSAGSQILQQVLGMVTQHNLKTDLLIAGFDDGGHHLFAVTHPGTLVPMDMLGFTAIGSGGLHAAIRLSLGGQSKSSALADTVLTVYQAKQAAEVAPGVGKRTDMAILKDGKVCLAGAELFNILDGIQRAPQSVTPEERGLIEKACLDHVS